MQYWSMTDTAAALREPMTTFERSNEPDDATHIARSLAEPAAFRAVFARHHDSIHRFVASRIGPDAAQDVVSETFLQAFRIRQRFDSARGTDALPWLIGIASRLVSRSRGAEVRWQRRQAAAMRSEPRLAAIHGSDSPDVLRRLDAERLRPELVAALGDLRRADRDALCACVLAGLSYQEAAVALGVPIGTIRSRVARARERLRSALEPS